MTSARIIPVSTSATSDGQNKQQGETSGALKLPPVEIVSLGGSMDFTYRIDKANRIVYLEGDDPSFELWRRTMLAVFADPEFETGFNFLSDRRCAIEARSSAYLRDALDFIKAHDNEIGSCKWATVVSTIVAFGMGRMTQILSEDLSIEVEVFKDIDEAIVWLLQDRVA